MASLNPKPVSVCKNKNGGTGGPFLHFKSNRIEEKVAVVADLSLAPGMKNLSSNCSTGSDVKANNHPSSLGAEANSQPQRKTKPCWSLELHRRFVNVLQQLGGSDVATSKQITELIKVDGLTNDEVKCHLQIWDAGKRVLPLRLIQEVHEHVKPVTSLFIPPSGDKLYNGSLDKTIRVREIEQDEIHCIQVHNVKESVYSLSLNATIACYATQAMGAKAYNWMGGPKHINFKQNVKCVAMTDGNLYCGCNGYSIQLIFFVFLWGHF